MLKNVLFHPKIMVEHLCPKIGHRFGYKINKNQVLYMNNQIAFLRDHYIYPRGKTHFLVVMFA